MECFNHRENPSVGICKHCGRGVCTYCAVDVAGSLACRERCEKAVRDQIDATAENAWSAATSESTVRRTASMYLLFGTIFTYTGYQNTTLRALLIPAGIIFLLGGALSLIGGRRTAA